MPATGKALARNAFFGWEDIVFPVDWIFEHTRIAESVAKMVWLLIPIEYYVLTRFSGGFKLQDYVPAAAMALGCILSIFVVSCAIAYVNRLQGRRFDRTIRLWSMSLLLTWGGTLILLALSYAIGAHYGQNDVVGEWTCNVLPCPQSYPTLAWPTVLATLTTYLMYSSLIVVVFAVAARVHRRRAGSNLASERPSPQPYVFNVALVNALLMTFLHGITTL